MDNNLINIDDLVRQRLTGREEREPAGAWLRMRELLDKEEERKPVGFIWRRMFGGLAILVLISAISLGSYELSSSYKRSAGNNTPVIASSDVNTNTHNNQNPATNNNSIAPVAANDNTTDKHNKSTKTSAASGISDNHSKTTAKENTTTPVVTSAVTSTSVTQPAHHNTHNTADNVKSTIAATNSETAGKTNISENTTDNNTVADNHDAAPHNTPAVAKTTGKTPKTAITTRTSETTSGSTYAGSATPAAKAGETPAVATTKTGSNTNGLTDTKTEAKKSSLSGTNKHTQSDISEPAVATSNTTANSTDKSAPAVATTNTNANSTDKSTTETSANTKHSIAGNSSKPDGTAKKPGTKTQLAGNNKKHTGIAATNATTAKTGKGVNIKTIPLAGAAPTPVATTNSPAKKHGIASSIKASGSAKHIPSDKKTDKTAIAGADSKLTDDGDITTTIADKPAIKKAGKRGGTITATTAPVTAKGTTSIAHHAKPVTPALSKKSIITTGSGIAENDNTEAVSIRRGNKTIDKVTITERYIKISPNTYLLHLDTISMENINEEYSITNVAKSENSGPSKEAEENGNLTVNNGNALMAPGAQPPSESKTDEAIPAKETTKIKKANGHPFEPLQNAFNDIKYKINGTQFAMGLTGGINGTFFGPSSFNGFQFGATANFVFSESLNAMAELKYFHRANNDYTLNDNYSTYTYSGNGYTQQQMSLPYTFSTLHSFEMPVSIRYTKGKFNFFAGANLVYSFAINESQGLPVAGATKSFTGLVPGNDTTAKIKTGDFDARFGLGYLFGVSVQLSPSMSLDFRDVQTFWDNAHSAGAKEISSQLYRAPSFQISLGYRFAGKKEKDKE